MAKIVPQKHGGSLKIPEKWETHNPKWRPKKWVAYINDRLKSKGFEPAKKSEIEEIYLHLINLPQNELEKLLKDQKQPMLVRIVIRNMLDSKRGFDIIEKILDRWIGKPTQSLSNPDGTNITPEKITFEIVTNNKNET